jgi:DNA-binding MarR family transcriptional regulator
MNTAGECAREVLDVVPAVMRFIRVEMRSHRALGLSVPQFRALVFVERAGGASLAGVAEHLGLTPPSACKLVDGLQGRRLVTRRQHPKDRRRVTVAITQSGRRAVGDARRETQKSLTGILAAGDSRDLAAVTRSMGVLRRVFASGADAPAGRRFRRHADA